MINNITPTLKIPTNFEMFQTYIKFLKNIFGFIVDGVISVVDWQKVDEKSEPIEENRDDNDNDGKKQAGNEHTEEVGRSGDNLGGQTGASAAEKSESEIVEEKIAEKILSDFYFGEKNQKIFLFGESLTKLREYEESWEKFINGD